MRWQPRVPHAASLARAVGPAGGAEAYARLWLGVGVAAAVLHLLVALLTQSATAGVLAVCVWGGMFMCLEGRALVRRPAPTAPGFAIGALLLAAMLWRTAQITHWDAVFYGLPVVFCLGWLLLHRPVNRVAEFGDVLCVSAMLPVGFLLMRAVPTSELSALTAQLTRLLLGAIGVASTAKENVVLLPGGGVRIAGSCSGNEQVAQLVVIAVVFLLVFRMRSWTRRACMLLLAPVLGIVGNSVRIALLAIITASDWAAKERLFRFFHEEYGSLVFAGLTVWVFGLLYLRVLEPELAPRPVDTAHA